MASGPSNSTGRGASTSTVVEPSEYTSGSEDKQLAQSLQFVQRGHEKFFDDLVIEVGPMVGMPFCFVCFVGPESGLVSVKAACGEIAETLPYMGSFIEDVIEGQYQPVHEVLDARATSAYSMDELVLFPPHLRYFAGTQIVHSGVAIGALIVADGAIRDERISAERASYLELCAKCIGEYLAATTATGLPTTGAL